MSFAESHTDFSVHPNVVRAVCELGILSSQDCYDLMISTKKFDLELARGAIIKRPELLQEIILHPDLQIDFMDLQKLIESSAGRVATSRFSRDPNLALALNGIIVEELGRH